MSKRDEIINTYRCNNPYGEFCSNDCKECEKEIAEMLDDFEKEIRADAIEEAIHHLDNCTTVCHEDYVDGIHYSIGVLQQLKEKKNEQG